LPGIDALRLSELGLTRREMAVLELVAEGRTNEQIGEVLGLSPLTVKKHLERMSMKLGAPNRAALVAVAWQRSGTVGAPPKRRPETRQTRT
jgi:DNA-binding CsgD family transcriptional regulator